MADFTGNSIQNTYQKVLQLDTGSIQDGLGNVVNIPTNQLSGSTLLSSSAQIASQISGSFNAASGGLASRVASQETFSSSLNTTFATDAEVTAVSNSLVTTIAVNTTNINTLTSFTGSYASTSSVNNLTDATSSYAVTNQVNSFSSGQKITGSLIQSGAASFFQGTLNVFSAQTAGALANINSFIDSNGGSTQVFSGLQLIDQGGNDAKMEINSFTGLDGTNPVFRLLGGGSGSNADNTILRSFKDGTLEVTKGRT